MKIANILTAHDKAATWPDIDKLNMKYLITDHTNIALGHLDQERKNVQSTKVTSDISRTHNILTKIIPFFAKEISYGDLTGAFPYTSSCGHKYLYVMYNHDSNGILVAPLKNRNSATIVTAWKALFNEVTKQGHTTKMFVLDNEFSSQLKDTLTKAHLTFQLVPPHVHQRDAAERAIKTFKNHFLSHKSGIVSAFKQVATLLNNNPRIFSQYVVSKKVILSHGPRNWIPAKMDLHLQPRALLLGITREIRGCEPFFLRKYVPTHEHRAHI